MKTIATFVLHFSDQHRAAMYALTMLLFMTSILTQSILAQSVNLFSAEKQSAALSTTQPPVNLVAAAAYKPATVYAGSYSDTSYIKSVDTTLGTGRAVHHADEEVPFDELSVTLTVQRIGSLEIPVLIYGQQVYLPAKDIFDFLKIKTTISDNLDSLSGFFIHPSAPYVIDHSRNQITYQGIVHNARRDGMIRTETNLYLKIDLFGLIFGLDCVFNFRSLSATLSSSVELPALREMQQEMLRKNISRLKGEKKADTTIKAGGAFFRAGVADWSITHIKESEIRSNTRLSLSLGAMIAGGEANLHLNYNSIEKGSARQQYYSWRHVNNSNKILRQFVAGKINAPSVSSLFSPVKGFQLTNTPSTYRRSYGTYRLSNQTEPGWTVELYVNNVLVNYVKADASGFFTFDVPLVYGNSIVQLKFYGPWGEERIREQNISIPFNFLPVNQLEYGITAGIVDDSTNDKFSRAVLNYGLGKRITIGGGVEYLTSANCGRIMPFANASLRIASGILLSAEHVKDVRTKGMLSYRLPSNLQIEMNYTKYAEGQTAVRYNYLEEKRVSITKPFRRNKFSAFGKLAFNQYTTPNELIKAPELVFSSVIAGVSSNITTSAILRESMDPFIFTNLAVTFRLPKTIRVTPQVQFEYAQRNFSMLKLEAEKSLRGNGFVNISYEKNMFTNANNITLGLRYNLSFAQTFFSVRKSDVPVNNKERNDLSTVLSARGSLIHDKHSGKLIGSNQVNIGKGGLVFAPFLDMNHNGRRDAGEPAVKGLKLRINSGRLNIDRKDSTIRITGLDAYTNYLVEFDRNSLQNISWKLKHASLRITIEPNHIKVVEVPVLVLGEAAGYVYLKKGDGQEGIGRVIVNIFDKAGLLVAKTLSEQDGYFSYLGLAPGEYKVMPDEEQLSKLKMITTGAKVITISQSRDGDLVDNIDLIINTN